MLHPILERYARLLVRYCTDVQPGETVLIHTPTSTPDIARAITREVLRADGTPHLRLTYPEWTEDLLELAPDGYFDRTPDFEITEIERVDAWIRIGAPHNTRAMQEVDKTRMGRLLKRNRPVQNIRLQRTKWVGSLAPTDAGAQDAGMSTDAYERFVWGAMYLFDDDPVAKWREIHEMQARLIERLSRAKSLRIVKDRTDLTLEVGGRTWINSDGHRNMPSGEVFTSPIETSASGTIHFDIPSSVNGVEVAGVTLRFEDGVVVDAHADEGDDLLQAQLDTDAGARRLGELGIGTNYGITRPTKSILFDEKIGGTVHLALGQSYREAGGTNESAIHWDIITDLRGGGTILLDGEPFQQDGRFLE